MCKLVKIRNSLGEEIEVAEMKADTIIQIIKIAKICDKIDYIYLFGSSVEERCTDESDIDLAIISNVTASKLYSRSSYRKFKERLYAIDRDQEYDRLQFNSLKAIRNSKPDEKVFPFSSGVILHEYFLYPRTPL